MRRMVKEDLLTFEGKPLFPERIAETVPYELTDARARPLRGGHRLRPRGDEPRRPARRQAPEHRRLRAHRPAAPPRLQPRGDLPVASSAARSGSSARKQEILDGTLTREPRPPTSTSSDFDDDELQRRGARGARGGAASTRPPPPRPSRSSTPSSSSSPDLDRRSPSRSATPAPTASGPSCRTILQDNALTTDADGWPRKLIIFTEHRDTLDYLARPDPRRCSARPTPSSRSTAASAATSAARSPRSSPRTRTCQILLATDAAGEGLNLQAAHLMVNYDLPWNPNRIEQRFGRIHRIGQTEVCHLWNLVAANTREGEVFTRLLEKIEEQRKAYGGKVFDVLGEAFTETPLRDLLIEAIRYGERPEVQAQDARGHRRQRRRRPQGAPRRARARLRAPRRRRPRRSCAPRWTRPAPAACSRTTSSWRSRRRSPGSAAGSRKREQGRYEIANVPAAHPRQQARADRHQVRPRHLRPRPRPARRPGAAPTCSRPGTRSTTRSWTRRSASSAAPSTAAPCSSRRRWRSRTCSSASSRRSPTPPATSVARRFGYAYVDSFGTVDPGRPGAVPRLRRRTRRARPSTAARSLPWLADAEDRADELDHRQPAARVPRRGPAAPRGRAATRPATWSTKRLDRRARPAPPRRRGRRRRRSRPARSPRSRPRA